MKRENSLKNTPLYPIFQNIPGCISVGLTVGVGVGVGVCGTVVVDSVGHERQRMSTKYPDHCSARHSRTISGDVSPQQVWLPYGQVSPSSDDRHAPHPYPSKLLGLSSGQPAGRIVVDGVGVGGFVVDDFVVDGVVVGGFVVGGFVVDDIGMIVGVSIPHVSVGHTVGAALDAIGC